MLPTMWAQKLNKLDDSKKFSILKKGIGIEGEKIMETRERSKKQVGKQVREWK